MNNDWELKRLGEICEFINRGVSPKYIESDGLRVLNQKCIRNHRINYDLARFHDNKAKPVSSEKLIQIGDVLVNSTGTGTLGRVAQVSENLDTVTVDSHVTIVRPLKNLFYNDFFGYALIFIEGEIAKKGEGCGGQTELSRDTLKNDFEIAFPKSLLEQQRIVSILDESFVTIDKARENAEKNLKNAHEIFESCLQNIYSNLYDETVTTEFGDMIETLTDYHANGSYSILKQNVELKKEEDFALMVRSTDFENDFKNDMRYISQESYKFLKKSKLYGDELIISKIGNAGKVYLMPKINRPCSLAMNLFLVRINNKKAYSKYLYYYLNSKHGEAQISSRLNGTATKTITKENVRNLKIPLVSLEKQLAIVAKLDALSSETKKLEAIYQQKLAALDELKKSVLQKAFNGEFAGA